MWYCARHLAFASAVLASPGAIFGAWPFSSDGPRRGSAEYYCQRANDPVGERQKFHHGKMWPPYARPCGPEQTFVHKYHANKYWPYPYVEQDRSDVRMVMHTQAANGWATATTLYDYHFDQNTHQLNSAGQQHLDWICTHTPPAFRQIYVSATNDVTINDVRTVSVQRQLGVRTGSESAMSVALRHTNQLGRPATEVEQIFTNAANNALPPMIQYRDIGTAATGGN